MVISLRTFAAFSRSLAVPRGLVFVILLCIVHVRKAPCLRQSIRFRWAEQSASICGCVCV